jgi:hypothetical protein
MIDSMHGTPSNLRTLNPPAEILVGERQRAPRLEVLSERRFFVHRPGVALMDRHGLAILGHAFGVGDFEGEQDFVLLLALALIGRVLGAKVDHAIGDASAMATTATGTRLW